MNQFEGKFFESVIKTHHLDKYFTHGSSAMLFHTENSSTIYRLTTSEQSHALLIEGAKCNLSFPLVYANHGSVAQSDDCDLESYWLGEFEKCTEITKHNLKEYSAFSLFLDDMETIQSEYDCTSPELYKRAKEAVIKHQECLQKLSLTKTILFAIDFADHTFSDLDLNETNFMINKQNKVVGVDLIHG